MNHAKISAVCSALLLACALTGCEVSADPNQPVSVADMASSASLDEQSSDVAGQTETPSANGDTASSAAENSSKPDAPANGGNSQAAAQDTPAQAQNDTPAQAQNETPAADNHGNSYEVGSEPTLSIGVVNAKAGQKNVPVSVKMTNNPGYAAGGIRVVYDPALTPKYDPDTEEAVSDTGTAAGSALTYCTVSLENKNVAIGILGKENCTEDGILFTCYFDVPADAKSGTVYLLKTEMDKLVTAEGQSVNVKLIGGEIRIQ